MPARSFLLLFLICLGSLPLAAQAIRGEVLDMETRKPLKDVAISNIYTDLSISDGEDGSFLIAASAGQLIEFRRTGYKTARVRIPQGYLPPFFRIIMQKGLTPLQDMYADANGRSDRYDPRKDSIRFYELYKHQLEFPRLSVLGSIEHPFSAMSGKNREIWRFQDDYHEFEQEKYVDRTFNPQLITKMTGLTGDSLRNYMRRFRPSYEQLRSMNDYTFYNFIKSSVHRFRNVNRPVMAQ